MLNDRHDNIFYYYRGPSSKAWASDEAKEHAYDRQVEDNTTKALINVLKHGDPDLTTSFLQRFVPQASIDERAEPKYYLQGHPKAPREAAWLLGISVLGKEGEQPDPVEGGSRVDAAIHLPGSALVGIEVKTVEYLNSDQLDRHADGLRRVTENDPGRCFAPWADVYQWASKAREATADDKTPFLLQQFCEYLELRGLAPYAGFRKEHFDWLDKKDDRSADLQSEIKAQLRALWKAILDSGALSDDQVQLLGSEIHVNRLPGDAKVAASHAPEVLVLNQRQGRWKRDTSRVNIGVELTAGELQVNLVAWNEPPAKRFEEWLAPEGNVRSNFFVEDLELAVFRRRPYNYAKKGSGKGAWWRQETFECLERCFAADLADKDLAELTNGWRRDTDRAFTTTPPNAYGKPSDSRPCCTIEADTRWEKLAYHLRRAWPRETVLEAGAELVDEVAEIVSVFVPLLAPLNPPPPQSRIGPTRSGSAVRN